MSSLKRTSFRTGTGRAILGIFALLATLIVSASPAAAATRCTNFDGKVQVILSDKTAGLVTTVGVQGNRLFVNGVACGTGSAVSIIDIDNVVNHVKLDIRNPMRMDGKVAFVSLFLDNQELVTKDVDKVTVLGSSIRDKAVLGPHNLIFNQVADIAPGDTTSLAMGFGKDRNETINLDIQLGGGGDSFNMFQNDNAWFDGPLTVRGGAGIDELNGGPGTQTLRGGGNADTLRGGTGDDTIFGDGGDDVILGGRGSDKLRGGPGDDTISGKGGADNIKGGSGIDTIRGGGGPDTLRGGSGSDKVYGGGGKDVIYGGTSADEVWGKSGNDTFHMVDRSSDVVRGGSGNDVCTCDSFDVVRL